MTESPQGHPKSLVVLVGSNPLPNYLAACALRPNCVALVYTEETKDAKDRLRRELARALGDHVAFDESFVKDATCVTTVRRALDALVSSNGDRDVLLNYTGGTKVMAAHARMAFSSSGGRPEHASYLDEGDSHRQARLRFDHGKSEPLSDYLEWPLTLLH